jgi:hypothetical protein
MNLQTASIIGYSGRARLGASRTTSVLRVGASEWRPHRALTLGICRETDQVESVWPNTPVEPTTYSVRSVRRESGMEECGNTLGVQAPSEPLELSIIGHSMV